MSKLYCIVVATILASLPQPSNAESSRDFCKSAQDAMRGDRTLETAAKTVFPQAGKSDGEENCLYPLALLHYDDADVMVATGGTPGEACHGCEASLSAYVLQRAPTGSRVVARFLDFDRTGSSGNPGDITALRLAGHDAFGVESGGAFQGYSATKLDLYLFRNRRLDHLHPALSVSASNDGAVVDNKQAIDVDGAWHAEPGAESEITIDYKVTAKGRSRTDHATWTVRDNELKLVRGHVPPEFDEASGN